MGNIGSSMGSKAHGSQAVIGTFFNAVDNMAMMLCQAFSMSPDLAVHQKAAQAYYLIVLAVFQKLHL
jgi:hypothetical protein